MTTYKYGLRARPLSIGTVPKDFMSYNAEYKDLSNRIRWGYVEYARELTKEEISNFELVEMNK